MYCKNCEKEIEDGNKFCPYCGKPLFENLNENEKDVVVNRSKGIKIPLIIIILVILLVIAIVSIVIVKNSSKRRTGKRSIFSNSVRTCTTLRFICNTI